ncbi:MAG: hypothetical protein ACR2OU_05045 [Thermomicrobiales bacterium]
MPPHKIQPAITISATLCDESPRTGSNANRLAIGGIVINVALASGEWIGSCTIGDPVDTPWGGQIAMGAVQGIPFNSSLIVTEDESTIPPGSVALENPQTFEVGNLTPGGGDQTTITFANVRQAPANVPPAKSTSTGRIARIYAGSCWNALGSVTAELTPVTMAQGEPVGQASGVEAETSHSTVNVLLDDIVDGPSAVAVFFSSDPNAGLAACGDIGGVNDHDGELVIGLREVNNSGHSGVARLAHNADDTSQTDVTIHLAATGQ